MTRSPGGAIAGLMGRRRIAGLVTADGPLLQATRLQAGIYDGDAAAPAATQFVGFPVYALTPCTEAQARKIGPDALRYSMPVAQWELAARTCPRSRHPATTSPAPRSTPPGARTPDATASAMARRTDCPACGARIIWAVTQAGKHQMLDWTPSPAGNVAAEQDVHGAWHARHAPPGEELVFPLKRYMPHAASSPACFRRRQQAAAQDVRDNLTHPEGTP